jgi:hypothetical protein
MNAGTVTGHAGAAAGKAGSSLKTMWPILVAVVLVIAAVYLYSTAGSTSGTAIVPGTNNDAAVAAQANANAQTSANFNSGIFTAFGQLTGLATSMDSNKSQLAATENTNQSQLSATLDQDAAAVRENYVSTQTGLLGLYNNNATGLQENANEVNGAYNLAVVQSNAQQYIAAQQSAASQAASHASQQNALWGGISSIFSGASSIFGLSSSRSANTGGGYTGPGNTASYGGYTGGNF